MKYTSGPWTYIKRKTLIHIESSIDARPSGEPVCSIPLSKEANARLIAAAPKMFELLKNIQDNLSMSATMERYANGLWQELNTIIMEAEGKE